MKRNDSPCIDECNFGSKNKWCIACGRTLDECKKWKQMKPYAKTKLFKELKRRLAILKSQY